MASSAIKVCIRRKISGACSMNDLCRNGVPFGRPYQAPFVVR